MEKGIQNYKIEDLKVENLIFDPLNPRLPSSYHSSSEEDVFRHMISRENVFDLMGSIGEQGYFPGEPLLVVESDQFPGKYEVVEGNRRLAALKLLNDPDLAPIKKFKIQEFVIEAIQVPKEVPVIIFEERDSILDYLGYRHITGVDQWDSLAKARYLYQLKNRHENQGLSGTELYKHLAKLIGSRSDYVRKLLNGFAYFKIIENADFFGINGLDEESFSFSLLTTATSYGNIGRYVDEKEPNEEGEPKEHLKDLVEWMFKENQEGVTRVKESRALKTLNSVIGSPKALQYFKSGRSLEEARIFTGEPLQSFEALISAAYNSLKLANDSLLQVTGFTDSHKEQVKEIRKLATIIMGGIDTVMLDED